MKRYQYTLEVGSKKYICPQCEKRTLVRYVNNETNEYLDDYVGRCDRENNCQYHCKPKDYFENHTGNDQMNFAPKRRRKRVASKLTETVPIPGKYLNETVGNSHKSHLIQFLKTQFDPSEIDERIDQFCIGSSDLYPGSTVYWQVDNHQKIRRGKIMQYHALSGKRIPLKEGLPIDHFHNNLMLKEALAKGYFDSEYIKGRAQWLQQLAEKGKIQNFKNPPCLFGEHQLVQGDSNRPVAIVESEKTALVMSIITPVCLWMATGSLGGLHASVIRSLRARSIILYPDIGAYEKWKIKMHQFRSEGYQISISDLLERKADERARKLGLDLADYFLKNGKNQVSQ